MSPDKDQKRTEAAPKKRAARTRAAEKDSTPARAASRFSNERLMSVLLAPVISEKATFIADKHEQAVFRVAADATKPEIKAAVELMFSSKDKKIEVMSVRVANVKGKEKRFGQYMGRRRNWKKAYVSLKPGQEINFAQEV